VRTAAVVLLLAASAIAAACGGARSRGGVLPAGSAGDDAASSDPVWRAAINPFPVLDEHGEPYDFPFLGGFNVPRPQFVDIDGDGDLDLFVQERTDELIFFENTGTRTAPEFTWRTNRFHDLEIGEWSRFVDLDEDGDLDLLAEQKYSYIKYYRNDGTVREPRFVLAADTVRAPDGQAVFSDRQNIPNLNDIDCNGRIDLFLGRVDGTITRHEMAGRDANGVPGFALITDRFENISIIGQITGMRHGANTMYFADPDRDGDMDLFWGDFFEPGVLMIENRGSCSLPSLQTEPIALTAVNDSVKTSGYNVPVLVDVDGDGDLDMVVGVLGGAFNPNRTSADNFYFYEREPDGLHLRTRRYLRVLDVGSESIPSLVDLDGDGDLDLIVSNKIDQERLETSRLFFFENTGGGTAPRFELRDTMDLHTAYHLAPAWGDLDGDGAIDLLLGTWNQGIAYFRNDGTAREPRFTLVDSAFITLTRGSNATPTLGDIDGDGDLDLFIGESSGELNFYRNEGSPTSPRFVLVSDTFDGIDVGRRSTPVLVDLDGDGLLDLVLGAEDGGARVFRNRGTRTEPRFVEDTTAFIRGLPHFSAPAFGDLDGDGDLDLISGGMSGGLIYLENRRR